MGSASSPRNQPPKDPQSGLAQKDIGLQLRKVRRRQLSQFSKRKATVLKKVHELQRDCGVDVYPCLRSRRNNRMWQYSDGFSNFAACPTASLKL